MHSEDPETIKSFLTYDKQNLRFSSGTTLTSKKLMLQELSAVKSLEIQSSSEQTRFVIQSLRPVIDEDTCTITYYPDRQVRLNMFDDFGGALGFPTKCRAFF